MRSLSHYKTIVFDCDGVILDSNRIKTDAFRQAASSYGAVATEALIKHHREHGGVSRYSKFQHFASHIAGFQDPYEIERLVQEYGRLVKSALVDCDIAPGLETLRERTPDTKWLVASGGDQQELREVFQKRNILGMFDAGIYGSPDPKMDIVTRELARENIAHPALFIGDSRYDHEVARAHGMDFIFVRKWSEFEDLAVYAVSNGIEVIDDLASLIERT
jgi:phosphoglycolate phosphatase-like HAD superfamily hydrolase